ncbi:MAG: hypothetical protein Q8898_04495, partial [Bacillota bacterium]|nr:hypothetical protein [Bacillota bacterium]
VDADGTAGDPSGFLEIGAGTVGFLRSDGHAVTIHAADGERDDVDAIATVEGLDDMVGEEC